MKTILKIAWRSIWRNRRRTLISMSAVGIGLALVIIYTGLMGAILGDAKRQVDSVGMGHVEITAAHWRARRGARDSIADPGALLARLDLPAKTEAGWRVVSRGLASSARGSEGIELHGVPWPLELQLSVHSRDVRQGRRPAAGDAAGVLIGEKLADRLKLRVGHKLRIMVQRADGEIGADLFRVRGIFHSASAAISARRVLTGEEAARRLLGVGPVAHQIVLQLDRAGEAEQVASRLRATLGPRFEVLTYGDLVPALRAMEALSDRVVWIIAVFVYLLVGLGILNTMLMSVMERTREFGVLRAIGTRPSRVLAQVLGEAFWIATLSAGLGLAAGLAVTWYGSERALLDMRAAVGEAIEFGGALIEAAFKTRFSVGDALRAAALVYVMALVTGLYPAWRVAKQPPARALHSS